MRLHWSECLMHPDGQKDPQKRRGLIAQSHPAGQLSGHPQ